MSFLEKALKLRPPICFNENSIDLQLVHGITRDGLPKTLSTPTFASRWNDETYVLSESSEDESGEAIVCLFGVNSNGNSAMVIVEGYRPFVRVELPEDFTKGDAEKMRMDLAKDFRLKNSIITLEMESLKRFYGWIPEKNSTKTKRFLYACFRFSTWKAASTATFIMEKNGMVVSDKSVKPISRFLNDSGLIPSSWASFNHVKRFDNSLQRMANTQAEFSCQYSNIVPILSDTIAPLLIMSFDGEMFSHDGDFPDVLKGDSTICIGASFSSYGRKDIKRFVLCVGDFTLGDETVEIVSFNTKKELFEGFRDLIVAADPDFTTGWNTKGFDYPFMDQDYATEFLQPYQRGSENLQISAIHIARQIMGIEHSSVLNSSELLDKMKSHKGYNFYKDWIQSAEKKYGSRHIKSIIKEQKLINSSESLLKYSDESSDDEEEFKSNGNVPAVIAEEIRKDLRQFLPDERGCQHFVSILKEANESQIEEFFKRIALRGKGIEILLKASIHPSQAKRALFLGRLSCERSYLAEKRMTSSARGDNTYYFWNMIGRIDVDLMQAIKDDLKPEDNSLKFAAQNWLGGGEDVMKMDLTAHEMFDSYASGDPIRRFEIAKYCARDCDIPILLIEKLKYISSWIEMSRVCYTWVQEIINSGQQVRFSNYKTPRVFIFNSFLPFPHR